MTSMTRDEYQKVPRVRRLAEQERREHRQGLAMLAQAAVKADLLTGNDAWDTYLTYLQAFLDQTKALQDQFEAKLADPMLVDHAEMLRAKISGLECAAMAKAISSAMALPKDILENGAKAQSMIERMDEESEDKAA